MHYLDTIWKSYELLKSESSQHMESSIRMKFGLRMGNIAWCVVDQNYFGQVGDIKKENLLPPSPLTGIEYSLIT